MFNVYKDIIPEKYNTYLQNILLDNKFPWNFWAISIPHCLKHSNRVYDIDKYSNPSQFKHVFKSRINTTDYIHIIYPIIDYYKQATNKEVLKLHSAAVILQHPVANSSTIEPHVDFDHKEFENSELITLVYYVTQANASTILYNEFYDGNPKKEVTELLRYKTEKGTLLEFNSDRFHSGMEPTDNIRILVNIILEIKC